jgi:hypothetical protein
LYEILFFILTALVIPLFSAIFDYLQTSSYSASKNFL